MQLALVACIALATACGGKHASDADLIPGNALDDAGGLGDAKANTDGAVDSGPPVLKDAGQPVDVVPPPPFETGPDPALVSIAVVPADNNLSPGGKVTLSVTGVYADGSDKDVTGAATFSSSDAQVATVANGVVTAVGPGKATIFVVVEGLVAFANVTVAQATVVAIAVNLMWTSLSTEEPFADSLHADATLSDGSHKDVTDEAIWSSSDSAVAYVSEGQVVGIRDGTVQISATLEMVQGSATLEVVGPSVTQITVRVRPLIAAVGDSITGEVEGQFDNGPVSKLRAVAWESSDPNVLTLSGTVSGPGTGVALAPGKTTLTAKLGDLAVGSVDVIVRNERLVGLEISPSPATVDYPKHIQLAAYGIFSDQSKYDVTEMAVWSFYDSSIVDFSASPGELVPSGLGTVKIAASFQGQSASTSLTVGPGSPVSLDIGTQPVTIANYETLTVNAKLGYADGSTLDVTSYATWASDDGNVVGVLSPPSGEGPFVALRGGATQVYAQVGTLTSAKRSVIVNDVALLTINLNKSQIFLGVGGQYVLGLGGDDSVAVSGTFADGTQGDISRSVTWKTGDANVATVSDQPATEVHVNGVVVGTTSLSATLGSVSATITVNVD
jgi:hypothetical protein